MKNLLQIDSLKDKVRMNTLINEYFLSRMNANGQYRVCLLAKIKSNPMLRNTAANCLLTWFSNSTDKFFILTSEFNPKLSRVISPDEGNEIESDDKRFFL